MSVNFAFRLSELINMSDSERNAKNRHIPYEWLTYAFADYVNKSWTLYRPDIPNATAINKKITIPIVITVSTIFFHIFLGLRKAKINVKANPSNNHVFMVVDE